MPVVLSSGGFNPVGYRNARWKWRVRTLLTVTIMGWAVSLPAHPPLRDSLAAVERHLASDPDDARALATRGELLRLSGDKAGAAASLAAALALDPQMEQAELFRAKLFQEVGRPDAAVEAATAYLNSVSTGAPLHAAAFVIRARAHRGMGDLDAALEDLDRALAVAHRPSPELVLERLELWRESLAAREPGLSTGIQSALLLNAFDEAIDLLGPTPALVLRATELAIQLADVDGALSHLDTLRAHAERQDAWLESRGEILLQAGRQQEAAAAFIAALRELDQRSTTRRTADATVARRYRLERRVRELGTHDPSDVTIRSFESAHPVQNSGARTWAASPSPGSVVLTRGPYVQLATDSSIVVRWRTDLDSSSRVAWGPTPSELDSEIVDLSEVTEHEVEIEGLDPSTCYVYEVGTATDLLAGGDTGHLLCTAAEEDEAVRVWVIGDSGTANHNAAAVRDAYLGLFPDPRPDVWLMLGDNAYTQGTDAEYQAAVFEMYPTILAHAAVWPTIGNHDALSSSSVSQTGPYFENFTLPAGGEAGGMISGTEAYYSFDHGPVHFVCLDSSGFSTPPTAMLDWLVADLVSTARQWVMVYFHHPPYSKGSHDSDNPNDSGGRMFKMREIVLPILESHGVDLVLSGHSHSYERSVLLDGHYGTSDTLTPEMIVDGGDGSPVGDGAYIKSPGAHQGTVYAVAGSSGLVSNGDLDHPVMVVSLRELGSMVLLVDPQSLEAVFLNADSQTPDLFRIEKPPSNQPPVAEGDAYTTDEDVPLDVAALGVLDNDSDADGDPLTAILVSGPSDPGGGQMGPVVITQPSNATLTLNSDGSFSYTPSPDFFGMDNFTYVANDGLLNSNVATVTITVNPIDDAPVAADDTYATDVDWTRNVAAPGVLGNDRHPDGDPITAIEVTGPSSGTLSLSADGSFAYTPDPGFAGTDAFTYQARGGLLDSNVATVTIHVGPSMSFTDDFESGDTSAWSSTMP